MNIQYYLLSFSIIIDGPNFINSLLRHDWKKEEIIKKLNLSNLEKIIVRVTEKIPGSPIAQCRGIDFFHSHRLIEKFDHEEQRQLISFLQRQKNMSTHEIIIESNKKKKEKGVDVAVTVRMFEMANICDCIVLVAQDSDYLPVLEALKRMGKYVILMGFSDCPEELINHSNLFIDIKDHKEILSKPFEIYEISGQIQV